MLTVNFMANKSQKNFRVLLSALNCLRQDFEPFPYKFLPIRSDNQHISQRARLIHVQISVEFFHWWEPLLPQSRPTTNPPVSSSFIRRFLLRISNLIDKIRLRCTKSQFVLLVSNLATLRSRKLSLSYQKGYNKQYQPSFPTVHLQ